MHFIYQPSPQITTTTLINTQTPTFFFCNPIISNEKIKHKMRFSQKEDDLLRALVNEQKDGVNWKAISQIMNGRTPRQCRERYNDYLRPNILNGKWTDEEDQLLMKLHEKLGSQWSMIAQHFPQRSRINIKNHYKSIVTKQSRNRNHEINSITTQFQCNPLASEKIYQNNSSQEEKIETKNQMTSFKILTSPTPINITIKKYS